MKKMIEQRPSDGYDWLYEDRGENGRYFTDVVYLPEGTPLWEQCTDDEKLAWEELNKVEEPQEEEVVE